MGNATSARTGKRRKVADNALGKETIAAACSSLSRRRQHQQRAALIEEAMSALLQHHRVNVKRVATPTSDSTSRLRKPRAGPAVGALQPDYQPA